MRGGDVWAVGSATRQSDTPLLGSGSGHGAAPCIVRVGEEKGTGQGGFEPAKASSGGLLLPQPLPFQVRLGSDQSQRGSTTPAELVWVGL